MFFLFFAKPSLIQKLALGNAVMGMFPDGGRFARGTLREGTFCLCRGFDQRTFSKQLKISESSERLRVHSVHSTPCTVCALLCTVYTIPGRRRWSGLEWISPASAGWTWIRAGPCWTPPRGRRCRTGWGPGTGCSWCWGSRLVFCFVWQCTFCILKGTVSQALYSKSWRYSYREFEYFT